MSPTCSAIRSLPSGSGWRSAGACSGGDRAGLLDGAILATGAVVIWWAFVLGPLVAASDPEPLSFAISVAYPIGDLCSSAWRSGW